MTIRRIATDAPEADSVARMVNDEFGYYGAPYWAWKYSDPGGPPSVVLVADLNGEVVGCNHYLALDYHLGGRKVVPGLAAGDLLVNPELRRQHIATELSIEGRKIATAAHPEAAFIAMFTWRSLGEYYEGLFGYTKVEPGYRQWSKRLNWEGPLGKLAALNERLVVKYPGLTQVDHILRLELDSAPRLDLQVGPGGFQAATDTTKPVLRVRGSTTTVLASSKSRLAPVRLAIAFLTRRVRISAAPKTIREAISVAGAYRAVIRTLKRG